MNLDERREKVAQMSKTIFQYCLSRTSSYQEAEDLSQEIILTLCERIEYLRDEQAFYAYVWRTADHLLRGWYRDRDKRRTAPSDDTLSDNPWERLTEQEQENEQLMLITRELAILNSNYRHVMVAYYVDGLSIKDISADLSLSVSMVKYLLFQSRKRIKEGIAMERNYGEYSYNPIELSLMFWGGRNHYWGKFDNKVRQNILMACYYDKQSEEQISLQLGVPTAYLEDDIKALTDYELLYEKRGFYQCNIPIFTRKVLDEIGYANKNAVSTIAELMKENIDFLIPSVRELNFYGSDMTLNSVKWMLVSLILHLAYIDMLDGERPLKYPTDKFGQKCFRFFIEKSVSDPYSFGTSNIRSEYGTILFWDVAVNGDMLHPGMTYARADMLGSLMEHQPQTENERLICAELLELGLAVKTDEGIKPNFPCFTKEQGDKLNSMIQNMGWEICQNIVSRVDNLKKRLIDHSPAHLADYVSQMAQLLTFEEIKQEMQLLCESGWLLPMKGGMSATTVMYLKE